MADVGKQKDARRAGAHPHQRKDGRYEAKIMVAGKQVSIYGKTAEDVERKRAARLEDRDRGLPLTGERQTVGQCVEKWLERRRDELRESTYRRYQSLLRVHVLPTLGAMPLAKLTPAHLRSLYAARMAAPVRGKPSMRASSSTIQRVATLLHQVLASAMEEGLVRRNICDQVDPPRDQRRETKPLGQEQMQALRDALQGDRLEALYVLALETGMRQGALLGLRWEDVDLSAGVVQVEATHQWRKGRKDASHEPTTEALRRTMRLSDTAREALRRHRERQLAEQRSLERMALGGAWHDRGLVFCNEFGEALMGDSVRRTHFYGVLERAGLPRVRFDDLRRAGYNPSHR
jgi:integrase